MIKNYHGPAVGQYACFVRFKNKGIEIGIFLDQVKRNKKKKTNSLTCQVMLKWKDVCTSSSDKIMDFAVIEWDWEGFEIQSSLRLMMLLIAKENQMIFYWTVKSTDKAWMRS